MINMAGWVPIATIELECPFCGKMGVSAKYIPPSIQSHSSRSAAGSKTQIYRVLERYECITGCRFCGKSDREVEKALKEGKVDIEKERRILERLKKQGILRNEITTRF